MTKWIVGGLALSAVAALTIVMIVQIVTSDRVDVTDLEVGDCVEFPVDRSGDAGFEEIGTVETVDCDDPHTAQVIGVGDLNPDRDRAFPGDDVLLVEVDGRCAAIESDPRFGVLPIVPTESTWEVRSGRYLCVGLTLGIVPVTGDHAAVDR